MKQCLQCQSQFQITDSDRAFYRKVDVPEPKRCPDCRQQRRCTWRNERVLYPRTCDKCGKDIISIYSKNKPYTVYCSQCWWSDDWTALEYGREFDFNRPFFEQFRELQLKVPRIALYGKNNENSDYTNHTDHAKNSYMAVDVGFGENILYSQWIIRCHDMVDCYMMENAELCYECLYTDTLYNSVGCFLADNSSDCYFVDHCIGASSCVLTANRRHGQHLWSGKQLTPAEWNKRRAQTDFGSYKIFSDYYQQFLTMRQEAVRKHVEMIQSERCTGDYIYKSKNLRECFDVIESEDSAFCYECIGIKDAYDVYESGFSCEQQYETHACNRTSFSKFCSVCYDSSFLEYCEMSYNSSNLFACIGLKRNDFCILNKQYSKEEFQSLREKIIAQMRKTGEYGEFFPEALSPFGYNETVAPYHYPLSKEEVMARGWSWEDAAAGMFGKTTLPPQDLPDHIRDARDEITKAVLECTSCKRNYKIIAQELDLYRKINVPVPRQCPDCRYMIRMQMRNPRKLWHRECMCDLNGHDHDAGMPGHPTGSACGRKFETTYAPERSEKVFCEQCYQQEVV